ncbi:hypothetical protein [Streptomyces vietnamensis]|uniref:hypothetical protein n=1 Tax=Streptomyces vietnamensis TaxID=362257 RepID=UPI00342020DD
MIATNPASTAAPALRGRIAGAALLAVLALTGCGPFGGDAGSQTPAKGGASPSSPPAVPAVQPAPEPSQSSTAYEAPDDWTEPERWTALPRGSRRDEEGSEVGFPHTAEGGVAMLATANTTSIEGE